MSSSFRAVWDRIKPLIPDLFTKGRLNFITIHYLYISGMALTGSVIIYAIGGMPYIDALFFGSGGATQSGLNTIDVNKIHTGQQFLLYMLSMLCNPIFIHSSVVYVRLYWFEKRFKHVVEEARNLRRSKSKGRSVSKAKNDPELGRKEKGVRGRSIVVLHDGHTFDGSLEEEKSKANAAEESLSSSSARNESVTSSNDTAQGEIPSERQGALGADGAVPEIIQPPQRHNMDHHIAFLENQRSPKDKSTLRIPSPREFDRGGKPEDVGDEENAALTRKATGRLDQPHLGPVDFGRTPVSANHITINEPKISRSREKASPFPRLETEKNGSRSSSAQPSASLFSKVRSRRASDIKGLISANTTFFKSKEEEPKEQAPYLSWVPTVVRNSTFVNLNEEQREELGGIEYRALKTLAVVLIAYFFLFHAFGVICLTPWIMESATYGSVVTSFGQGRPWWGVFTAGSAFNDLGFTLTPDSMISFGTAVFPLLLMTFLIIIGNTGFPCMLRFVIWFTSKLVPRGTGLWEELQFLLDHPRRCFTLLFPRAATWWLFAIVIALNALDLIFFVILDLNDETVSRMPGFQKFTNGLFQAASTRTAGFSVVNLSLLHPAIQVSYLIMMYISVFPIAISMRRTNVYEEKSLGIYGERPANGDGDDSEPSYIGAHLRKQLSFDLWYVFLGLFIIAIVEGDRLENTNEYAFTLFSVLFEIISAYGTVGLSLGYPTINASFSGEFRTVSKLVIIAMQIRGRHRGLPYELDRAVLLPSESLQEKEAAEASRMLQRRMTSLSDTSKRDLSRMQSPASQSQTPFTPFTPSPPQDNALTSAVTVSNDDMKERLANIESLHNEKPSGPVRSGLGNAMFRLASPMHKQVPEGGETKQD
ncbi:hypothetical protein EPUS_07049 [Endocarpon pusillum Z07020]|uniref:Potassium transport protein n=1 Tax=Endocarpon pusillum (strain Z07020 / HMAS-L-300199) TaxID=1263415 RepID=U1GCL6_ENDPU|nr:uncharacterized protein EPUS_07049 [Endocarpon pusillum Z07020]ERF69793.1 hypothetical protein EPUS_07049 [Endocarpon pusillum Z07020]